MCTNCNSSSCNGCNKCCSADALRYCGPDLECIGLETNTPYETIIQQYGQELCDILESLDGLNGLDHVSFTSSTGTPSSTPNQPCETDTYTFWADVAETVSLGTFTIVNPCDNAVNYADVAWVDDFFGDDSTGVVGRFDLPYKTITAALAAANTGTDPHPTVYVRRGDFTETVDLITQCRIYILPGVTFTDGGFQHLGDEPIVASVFGYGRFLVDSTPLLLPNNGSVTFQCDYVDNNPSAFYVAGSASADIQARYIRCQGQAATFINSFRDDAVVTMVIKEFCEGPHAPYFFRGQNTKIFSGDVRIECPVSRTIEGGPYGNIRKAVLDIDRNDSGSVTLIGDMESRNTTLDANNVGVVRHALNQGTKTRVVLTGNIIGVVEAGIVSNFYGDYLDLTFTGNIYTPSNSGIIVVNPNRPTLDITLRLFEAKIHQDTESTLGQGITAYLHHCSFYMPGNDKNIINVNDTGVNNTNIYTYYCIAETGGGGGYFIADNSAGGFSPNVGCIQSYANIPLDILIAPDIWAGFTQVASLVVPQLN